MGNIPRFHKRLEFSFLYIGRCLKAGVPLFETIFFGWAFLQPTCFIDKREREIPERDTQMLDGEREKTYKRRAERRTDCSSNFVLIKS